jgi:hypothetical protein
MESKNYWFSPARKNKYTKYASKKLFVRSRFIVECIKKLGSAVNLDCKILELGVMLEGIWSI